MTTLMKAPSGAASQIFFRDGSTANVDANGYIACPIDFVPDLERVGFTDTSALRGETLPLSIYTAMTDTTNATILAASMVGSDITINMTGTLGSGQTLTLPTVAQLIAALPEAVVGQRLKMRVINSGAGNFAWTLTTATTWTMVGTQSVAQNTWRDFYLSIDSAVTGTVTQRGTGTNS